MKYYSQIGQDKWVHSIIGNKRNGYVYVKGNDDIQNWGHGPIDDFYIFPM